MAAGVKAAELRELSEQELITRLREAKAELFNLRVQTATGQLDNNRRLHAVRKDIARIYTVLQERTLGITEDPNTADTADDSSEPAPATVTRVKAASDE